MRNTEEERISVFRALSFHPRCGAEADFSTSIFEQSDTNRLRFRTSFLDIITCFGTRDNRLSLPSIFASSETVVDNVVYEQDVGGNLINVELTVSRLLMNDMMDRFQLAHLVIPVQ